MTIELKSVCGYIRTNAKDRTFDERLAFLKSVIELHEDWKCEDILIDRSGLLGINRPSLASIVEKMENGELKYIVVTHFAVIHPNVEILQKFVNKLKDGFAAKQIEEAKEEAPAPKSEEVILLEQIRDALQK